VPMMPRPMRAAAIAPMVCCPRCDQASRAVPLTFSRPGRFLRAPRPGRFLRASRIRARSRTPARPSGSGRGFASGLFLAGRAWGAGRRGTGFWLAACAFGFWHDARQNRQHNSDYRVRVFRARTAPMHACADSDFAFNPRWRAVLGADDNRNYVARSPAPGLPAPLAVLAVFWRASLPSRGLAASSVSRRPLLSGWGRGLGFAARAVFALGGFFAAWPLLSLRGVALLAGSAFAPPSPPPSTQRGRCGGFPHGRAERGGGGDAWRFARFAPRPPRTPPTLPTPGRSAGGGGQQPTSRLGVGGEGGCYGGAGWFVFFRDRRHGPRFVDGVLLLAK